MQKNHFIRSTILPRILSVPAPALSKVEGPLWVHVMAGAAIVLFLCSACNKSKTTESTSSPQTIETQASSPSQAELLLHTYQNENGTWGYDIFRNEKRYIHQPDKPAIGGRVGFAKEEQAKAVGNLVLEKVRQGIMPPSVSAAEVDSVLNLFP